MKILKQLCVIALALCAPLQSYAQSIGLQMYSVRELMNDYAESGNTSIIDSIAGMGYDFVEAYGYSDGLFHNQEPVKFRNDIEEAGLTISSSHCSIQLLPEEIETGDYSESLSKWDSAIRAHKAAGINHIIMAWIQDPPTTIEGWFVYSSYLNAVGRKCRQAGIGFAYHNHWFEFDKVENNFPLDILITSTNPEYVSFELDAYWMATKGEEPAKWIERYPGRFKFIHLKDKTFLGSDNIIDYKAMMENCEKHGITNPIIEVEWYGDKDVMDAVRLSINNLKKMLQ